MAGKRYFIGPLVLTLAVAIGTGVGCARLVWEYTDWYEYYSLPPMAARFWLIALCYGLFWGLLGTATGMALAVPLPPWEIATILRLYFLCLILSLAIPICLLRWELPLISFVLAVLLLSLCCLLISAAARALRLAGLLLLPLFVFSTYQAYLLLGIYLLN
ncbi:MAG TPA: hypothetical protein GX499_01440 [Clostridiales bacterium]|nr:hypothetical protein [Clostridiales bacterium]